MQTLNEYCRAQFGEKLYKLSLNGGMTCPNRDGTLGVRGCIFCSAGGSGDFAPDARLSIPDQIEEAKARVAGKYRGSRYIAYFQAYTNTYAPVERLRELFTPVVEREDIAVLSVATRPDCLPGKVLDLLGELNRRKPVWVELGLQTIHPDTAAYLRRGYDLPCYERAAAELRARGIHVVTHVILCLPGEGREEMLQTARYVGQHSDGIKLQLLHVLEGTDLAADYRAGRVPLPTLEEYVALVRDCVKVLPEDMVVHRMTGDGPKRMLLAPQWSGDKKRVLNALNRALERS
ncbi:MAG: TIGR01212 family radical SAM protein [Clostridiales bacterium]|nr:MAG: TIGR01212 family radical SAM protein [Clostridiales bacterium]